MNTNRTEESVSIAECSHLSMNEGVLIREVSSFQGWCPQGLVPLYRHVFSFNIIVSFLPTCMYPQHTVIEGDYATCMHHLMHFPTVYEVNYLIQRSLHLRNPVRKELNATSWFVLTLTSSLFSNISSSSLSLPLSS